MAKPSLTRLGGASPPTPIAVVAGGLIAGAAGTAAMDALLYARYRRAGGTSGILEWEFSSTVHTWEAAPAPAHVGKRLIDGLFQVDLADHRARLVNNVTHWGYGILNGAAYGLVAGSLASPRYRHGALFGASVWASGYVVLPLTGLYKPMWEYDRKTLARDLSAHLVYGLATATAYRRLLS